MWTLSLIVVALFAFGRTASAIQGPFNEPNTWPDRTAIVHLFEWKWLDIARECTYLAKLGYAAVQISPPTENMIVHFEGQRPWYERYQPISYKLITRSGNEEDFQNMTRECNKVGIRIYVDLVINHMTGPCEEEGGECLGTGGSTAKPNEYSYPAVPYTKEHFHEECSVGDNYHDILNVRNCQLLGLRDLDHSQPYVRNKIIELMNHLIALGVAGFRVDAARHMWPYDLKLIYEGMTYLNTEYGFPEDTLPFLYQEVIDHGDGAIKYTEYPEGRNIDFRYNRRVSTVFSGTHPHFRLKSLEHADKGDYFVPGSISVVFIDNHDTQRDEPTLTYKNPKLYKMAVAFMLALPRGIPRVMSSYRFDTKEQGPPTKPGTEEILSPEFDAETAECINGYVCEHRWRPIRNMVAFSIAAGSSGSNDWWSNDEGDMLAFGRGDKAFIAFNKQYDVDMDETLQTGLPPGTYCDVISGGVDPSDVSKCTKKTIEVGLDRKARFSIKCTEDEGVIAIHVNAKLPPTAQF